VREVDATTIIEGDDDYFGEDDHMAHHYNTSTFYRDLRALQKSKEEVFKKNRASVFKKLSIFELSVLILLGQWERLAEHYVDYTGEANQQQIRLDLTWSSFLVIILSCVIHTARSLSVCSIYPRLLHAHLRLPVVLLLSCPSTVVASPPMILGFPLTALYHPSHVL